MAGNPLQKSDLSFYRLVLFDVDHTLLDFDKAEQEGIHRLWKHGFQSHASFEVFFRTYRQINSEIWNAVETNKLKPQQVKEARAKQVLQAFDLDTSDWESGADAFLSGLADVAIWLPGAERAFHAIRCYCDVGIITNGLVEVQFPRIAKIGIRPFLKTYQISQECGVSKPNPRIFQFALKETGHKPNQTLYIGDSVTSDLQGAANAEIDFCWFNPSQKPLPQGYPQPKFELHNWASILEN